MPSREVNPITGKEDAVRRCTGGLICPAQRGRAAQAFRVAQRLRHRGAGREAHQELLRRRADPIAADIFTLQSATRRSSTRLEAREGWGETSAAKLFAAIEARRNIDARPLHLCARHSPCRRDHRQAARPRTMAASTRSAMRCARRRRPRTARPMPSSTTSKASARGGGGHRRFLRRAAQRGGGRGAVEASHSPSRSEAVEYASPIAGKTVVFTGTLEKHDPPRGQGAGRASRRQGGGLGVEEDRLCRGRPRGRLEA